MQCNAIQSPRLEWEVERFTAKQAVGRGFGVDSCPLKEPVFAPKQTGSIIESVLMLSDDLFSK
jgi:hypothetical protein